MENNNYATVLENFVNTFSVQVAQVNTKKVLGLDHLVLNKKWGISPKNEHNIIFPTTQCGVCTVLLPSLSYHQLRYRRLPHIVYSDTLFATTVSRRCNGCAQIFAIDFG